jgi:hypothetical protein
VLEYDAVAITKMHKMIPVMKLNWGQAAHCIIYQNTIYDTVLNFNEHIVPDLQIAQQIKQYTSLPFLAIQGASYSDLQHRYMDYTSYFAESERNIKAVIPDSNTLTIVSAFFDLGKRENSDRRNAEDYLKHGKYIMELDVPKLIYCDPEYADDIHAMSLFPSKTTIIPVRLEDTYYYKKYFTELTTGSKNYKRAYTNNPTKDTPLYSITMWTKFSLLQQSMLKNTYRTSHFAWLDFGITHVSGTNEYNSEAFSCFSDKIKLLILKPWTQELVNSETYFHFHRGLNGAGYIQGPIKQMYNLCTYFDSECALAISSEWSPVDEQLLPKICTKYPDLFDFYYGDYSDILSNVKYHRTLNYCTNLALNEAINCNLQTHISLICNRVFEAITTRKLDLNRNKAESFKYISTVVQYLPQYKDIIQEIMSYFVA